MIEKVYPVSYEISGPAAMFTRPDTGSSPVSYPVPTKSALKSIFESVVFSSNAYFEPQKIEICAPIVFHKFVTNYSGPLRKSGKPNFQLFATILENVCYKVNGIILSNYPPRNGDNPQHKLQEIFTRRLEKGSFNSTPFLGWKEFIPDYFGPIRDTTAVERSINLELPSMLLTMYTCPTNGSIMPKFVQNVKITEGVLFYAE